MTDGALRLRAALASARRQRRAAFIPFLMAGDPSLAWTGCFLKALVEAGADVVELGVPFSDPVADGPVIQRAARRALRAGTTLLRVLGLVARLRAQGFAAPIVLFTYYNPVLSYGLGRFARDAARAGAQGALVVDLPPEAAGPYAAAMKRAGLGTVFLAAPTTSPARLKLIDRASTGFVYYVSRLGVTGVSRSLSRSLAGELRRVRRLVRNPVAVGFGIATPAQAREAAGHADAVVVGSALVRLAEGRRPAAAARRMRALARSIVKELKTCSS